MYSIMVKWLIQAVPINTQMKIGILQKEPNGLSCNRCNRLLVPEILCKKTKLEVMKLDISNLENHALAKKYSTICFHKTDSSISVKMWFGEQFPWLHCHMHIVKYFSDQTNYASNPHYDCMKSLCYACLFPQSWDCRS